MMEINIKNKNFSLFISKNSFLSLWDPAEPTISPDFFLISLGVDTFENDPISFFKLKSVDYFDVGRIISSLNLPTLFVTEGGYAINQIGINLSLIHI